MDAVYPEPMSRLHRRAVRKQVRRGSTGRYRTQPVTFAEIKEVDEENIDDGCGGELTAAAASKSELDLNSKFEEFWRAGREKANKKKKAKELIRSTTDEDDTNTLNPAPSIPPQVKPTPRPSI